MKRSRAEAPQRNLAPPLWVWLAAAAAVSVLFLLSVRAFSNFMPEKPFVLSAAERLERFAGKPGGKGLKAVAIGTSLFRRAILYDGKMEDLARKNGIGGLQFLRLTRNNCEFSDYASFFDKVLDAKPDVVLIEADTVFYLRRKKDFYKDYPEFLRYVFLKSLREKKLVVPDVETYEPDSPTDPPITEKETRERHEGNLYALQHRSLTELDTIGPLFRKAAASGVRLVLVQMQREPGFERLAGLDRSTTAALFKRIPAEYGAALIRYPGEIGTEYFWDQGHLNEDGRLKFSLWLIEALKGMDKRV